MMPSRGPLVQMAVPPVRPLLRRTVKRFLRLLPSILLLLFVISLIFVTLMQIAVIHTHRRLQRNPYQASGVANSGANTPFNQSLLQLISKANPKPMPTVKSPLAPAPNAKTVNSSPNKKTEVLRIEALLDRNLPSIETNSQVLQNFVNLGRIRQIITQFMANNGLNVTTVTDSLHIRPTNQLISSYSNVLDFLSFKTINKSETNNETKSLLPFDGQKYAHINVTNGYEELRRIRYSDNESNVAIDSSVDQLVINRSSDGHNYRLNSSPLMITKSKPFCSSVPPKLVGRVRIESHIQIDNKMSQIVKQNPHLNYGGFWEPYDCYARHRVAVIIPFRDRTQHLSILLYHLHPILRRQLLSYRIYVIEQFGNDTFNKGVLMNAGVREALKETDFHCFVFHDVDLLPEDDRNLYSCAFAPRHMSVAVDKFNYSLPYTDLVGGVFSMTKDSFILVNGYSNLYWGWGGEDDDMAHRLKFHNLHIIRPPESIGRYTMIKHNHRPESPNNVRSALLRMAKRRAFRDGLGSVRYKVIFKHNNRCYTHIMIDIGHIHKWHFPSPNKLVLHFK